MRFAADKLLLLRALRPAGGWLIAALAAAALMASLVPAATAITLARLIGGLERQTSNDLFLQALTSLAAFAVVVLLGHLSEAAVTPLEFLAQSRIDGAHRSRVMAAATSGKGIDKLERQEVQALIAEVSADPKNHVEYTPGDGSVAQLRWGMGLVGVGAACAVLATYRWSVVVWLLLITALVRRLQFRQVDGLTRKLQLAYGEEMHADVWREASISPAAGKDIRIFGFANWMIARMQDRIRAGNQPFWTALERMVRSSWLLFALILLGLLPAYVGVTLDAVRGVGSAAEQTAVFAASWVLLRAFAEPVDIQRMTGAVQVLHSFERLDTMLAPANPEPMDEATPAPERLPSGPPLVRFEGISFRYPSSERNVLEDVQLDVRPGELLAIVGLNGAGKSTLIKLLSGLYEPDAGRITVDGVDLRDLPMSRWRDRISVVFQDFVRYPLSAADNVALTRWGAETPALADIDAAAEEAGFTDVLRRLPNGWQTPLARSRSGGVDLSGGQWQQVVLTRALYALRRGARLLVLDEPTAHLDVRTEFEVFHRLAEHRGDISLVLISHRLSTVRYADRIVLLDQGRITESGTHQELMTAGGGYARLFATQADRFQADLYTPAEGRHLL